MCHIFYVPSISLIQLSSFAFSRFKGQEQEIDSSYDASSGDIMDLDEDLEELDLAETSSDEHATASQEATQAAMVATLVAPTPTQDINNSDFLASPTWAACLAAELQKDGIEPRGTAGITTASIFTLGAIACVVIGSASALNRKEWTISNNLLASCLRLRWLQKSALKLKETIAAWLLFDLIDMVLFDWSRW